MVGVGTGPPNVLLAPKPTSSVRMRRIFGAPLGALTSCGKSLVDSSTVRPMCPLNGGSGRGNTSCARVAAANNEVTAVLTLVSNMLRLFTFASPNFVVSRKSPPVREGLESLAAAAAYPTRDVRAVRFCYGRYTSTHVIPSTSQLSKSGRFSQKTV